MTLKPSAGGASALAWCKSSYSSNDGPNCVEVAWTKSSYSGSNDNDCVEVGVTPGTIHIRDSKDPDGPHLAFTPESWTAFLSFASNL